MGLDAYRGPRIEIGTWPVPIRRLDAVSTEAGIDVWAQIEGEARAWGGNKVRKLEFLLGDARADGVSTLVAYGAGTSSWASAVAWHGSRLGFRVVVGLAGPLPPELADLYARTNTRVIAMSRLEMLPAAVARARAVAGRDSVRLLPAGGSGGSGLIGSVGAGLEVAEAVSANRIPRPAWIAVAAGTCGTTAGLAVGTALGDLQIPVVAVRVAPFPFGTKAMMAAKVRSLVGKMRRAGLASGDLRPSEVVADARFLAPGYGRPGPEARRAIEVARNDGLELDPGYASKAMAAVIRRARDGAGGPALFVHTSPGRPPIGRGPGG